MLEPLFQSILAPFTPSIPQRLMESHTGKLGCYEQGLNTVNCIPFKLETKENNAYYNNAQNVIRKTVCLMSITARQLTGL